MTTPTTSSFSMKRFMTPHRRNEDSATLPFTTSNSMDDIDSSIDKHLSKKQLPRTKPWLYAPGRRREPPAPVMIRRDGSIHNISSPLPALPGDLPHSSTSSLCSCDMLDHIRPESRSYSSSKAAATLGLPDLPATPSISPGMVISRRPVRHTDRLLLSPEWNQSENDIHSRPSITFSDSGIDPLDVRGLGARRAEPQQSEASSSIDYSEDTQTFMRETDRAFMNSVSNFSDHKLDFNIPEEPSTPPPYESNRPSHETRRSISSFEDFSFDKAQKNKKIEEPQQPAAARAPSPSPAPVQTPAPASTPFTPAPTAAPSRATTQPVTPATKTRTRKASKVVPFQGRHRASRSQTGSRWNIPENVAEILTGRFKKIEADEVLTPAKIEELTKARAEALREKTARESSESARNSPTQESIMEKEVGTDKPLPPMPSADTAHGRAASHSSEGSSRRSQRTSSSVSSGFATRKSHSKSNASDFSVASTRKSSQAKSATSGMGQRKNSSDSSSSQDNDDESVEDDDDVLGGEDEDDVDEANRVSPITEEGEDFLPPPKNPARYRGPPKQRLPSLPSRRWSKRQSVQGGLQNEENDDYLFLRGTPYTLTKPLFRHGPITLSKADMGKVVMTMDDTLDWTAFQMAILGGAGELFLDEFEEEDDKMAEDLTDWFSGFGFESLGGLVVAEQPVSSRSSSRSTMSSIQSTDQDLPIPISTERPTGLDETGYDSSKFFRGSIGGPKPWMTEGDSPQRAKAETPPVTPMMPHVAEGDDEPGEVPMGYNLNHDLDDFLRWEAAHMTGAGF
jgi:hypothetical protein